MVSAVNPVTAVAAIAEAEPVRVPVTSPSIFAIKVPVVWPVPERFTVVVGSDWLPENNLNLSEVLASQTKPAYFVVEDWTYLPYQPKSTELPELLSAYLTSGSLIVTVVESTVESNPKSTDSVKNVVAPTFKSHISFNFSCLFALIYYYQFLLGHCHQV